MKIHGKEYGLFLTVGASAELSKLCENGDIANLMDLVVGGTYVDKLINSAKIICILSDGYEEHKFYENMGKYEKKKLTVEEILSLSSEELTALQESMFEALNDGAKTEVETEEIKKEEAAL